MMAPKPQDACALPREANMGRPSKIEPRDRQLNLSLSRSEFESIRSRAESAGMRPVHFSRAILLGERRKPVVRDDAENNVRLIYVQLIRLGNNLNQMVRHLHKYGGSLPADLEPLLREIRHLIRQGVWR